MQVRTTEGLASSRLLESYSLEEILQYLDAKGYEVDVRIKGIKPVGTILTQAPFKAVAKTPDPVVTEGVDLELPSSEDGKPAEGAAE